MLSYDPAHVTLAGGPLGPADLAAAEDRLQKVLPRLHVHRMHPAGSFIATPDAETGHVQALATRMAAEIDTLVVVGIGGSSLGTRAVWEALAESRSGRWIHKEGRPRVELLFVENVDPVELDDLLAGLDLERTGFNIVTKSGSTVETMSIFFILRGLLMERFGVDGYRKRLVVTADPIDSPLRAVAREDGLESLDIPQGVGGRFSVFTAVGIFPLAVAGVDVVELLDGACQARDRSLLPALEDNPALAFATVQLAAMEAGLCDVVFMPYVSRLRQLACWFVQLWAESLGKLRDGVPVGPTPMVAIGATDQHSQLQLFMEGPATRNIVFVALQSDRESLRVPAVPKAAGALSHLAGKSLHEIRDAELRGVQAALAEVSRPSSVFRLEALDPASIGALMMTLACATAITGWAMEIDPFDQPGVERAKHFAHVLLGRKDYDLGT